MELSSLVFGRIAKWIEEEFTHGVVEKDMKGNSKMGKCKELAIITMLVETNMKGSGKTIWKEEEAFNTEKMVIDCKETVEIG